MHPVQLVAVWQCFVNYTSDIDLTGIMCRVTPGRWAKRCCERCHGVRKESVDGLGCSKGRIVSVEGFQSILDCDYALEILWKY